MSFSAAIASILPASMAARYRHLPGPVRRAATGVVDRLPVAWPGAVCVTSVGPNGS